MEIAFYPRYFLRSLSVHGSRQGFFRAGYLLMYPECTRHGMSPWQHYVLEGRRKGYDLGNNPPDDLFFPEGYEAEYPDVKAAGYEPWRHYAEKGRKEGRDNGLHPVAGGFFPEGYLAMYPDAAESGMDAWHHYVLIGLKEGHDNGQHPGAGFFFPEGYLAMYPDAAESGMDAWHHYVLVGKKQGRDNGNNPPDDLFFPEGYEAEYPEVKAGGTDPWRHYAEKGRWEGRDNGLHPGADRFYAAGYIAMYPDAENSGMDAWHHYVLTGMREGRDNGNNPPPDLFFPEGYEAEYHDVKSGGHDAWHHYAEIGRREGRDCGLSPEKELFSAECYLEMYPDAAESGMDAWHHYVIIGMKEGRSSGIRRAEDEKQPVAWPDAGHFHSKNILIIAELSIPQCKLYRVDQKVTALESQGYKVLVSRWTDRSGSISLMQDCSVVIFYRVPWREDVIACFREARRLGIHTVFDIDDLVFDTDVYGQVLKDTQKSEAEKADLVDGVRLYCDAMLQADENWFSTRTLCELSDCDFGTHSVCVPNCIPEELFRVAREFEGERKDGSTVTIFYGAGSSTHDRDIAEISDVLEEILMKNDNVRLLLIGDIRFGFRNAELRNRITRIGRLGLEDYYYLISQCDIAVVPLEQSLFNTAKSNIKYIEASVLRIPSVCSDLREFSSVIKNGRNGFVAKSREEWAEDLQLLIESRKLRGSVGNAAYKTVTKLYSLDALAPKLASLFMPYAECSGKKKDTILLANVRYGLSAEGSTAAIVENLAEEIQNAGGIEVQVFSTYTDLHDPFGTLRRYGWHGVNVWAVNIATVNWGWSDAGIRQIFARVLKLVSPKLVHFHSIQTLGMDMCLECIERKIPYFVTMHDGWWICARKFLTDTRGRWCGEKVPSGTMCRVKCGVSNCDFFRKRHLAQYILRNAQKVWTPTDYFTDLIQRSFPTVVVHTMRNGIPQSARAAVTRAQGQRGAGGRIVLGFAGGRNEDAGYFFLRDCILSLGKDLDNFRLVLLDSARKNSAASGMGRDDWPLGTQFASPDSDGGMQDFFSRIDVLLYPPLRKELFGLTVSEAVSSGVFVVCSSCGGPAEAVRENENGLIFPTGDRKGFMECLRLLIKRKESVRSYKARNSGDFRTFRKQAHELLSEFASAGSAGQEGAPEAPESAGSR